jgi:alpha-L-rhamnosidase
VLFANGIHQWFAVSNETWKVQNGPVTFDDVYIGENYDARLATLGWDKPDYNDSAWQAAGPTKPTPPGELQAHLLYPQKIVQTYSPLRYWEPTPGVFVFDFGQNMAGWTQIRAIGPSGTTITLQHSEMVDVDTGELMFLYQHAPMVDTFTLAGTGDWEYFAAEFVFHGFQYVQITGFPGVPAAECIEAYFVHSALPEIGSFMCSNDVINTVDHLTRAAAISNFQSIPSDCPTREKRGWLGDAQVSAHTQMQYWDMGAAYTKYVQDIHDSQTKIGNGNLGDTAPWYPWGGTPADPAWGTAFTLLWYWSYVNFNDTRMLAEHYDAVKWYVSTLITQSNNVTGLLNGHDTAIGVLSAATLLVIALSFLLFITFFNCKYLWRYLRCWAKALIQNSTQSC